MNKISPIEIARIINKNGRQGPKNILSDEVYQWVKKEVKRLSYLDYEKIVKKNSILNTERNKNRNMVFVKGDRDTYDLFKLKNGK